MDFSIGQCEKMDFADALRALKNGYRVYNKCWNGPGMYLALQEPQTSMSLPYIYINMPKGHPLYPSKRVPWTPSQLDLMSEGWEICGPEVSD